MTKLATAIPTTVVNGFLGSGKTTIISHLIDQLIAKKTKVVYIKNEIGATDLDTELMRGKNIIGKELLNGCICCTLVGPFLGAIDEVINTYQPERIIIESAGNADPASLALIVENHPLLNRDGVITIVDVVNFSGFDQINEVIKHQAEFTDLIIFNKVELADEQRKKQVVGYVREINERAPIIEAQHGQIADELVFGLSQQSLESFIHDHAPHQHSPTAEIGAFTYQSPKQINKTALELLLQNLPKNVFRVKGFFFDQNQGWLVNQVFNRTTFSPLDLNVAGTKLIFVGYQIANNQPDIVKDLERL